jgi:hypothetical protein
VARRSNPARIKAAQREGTRQRLISAGLTPERVDELLDGIDSLPERDRPAEGDATFRWAMAQPRRH